jgi:ribosomal peptide maturation radical SAM protein 1
VARVVLVQMPFHSVGRPSIALSLLRGVLEEHGHRLEIRYLNIEYARRVGPSLYEMISRGQSASSLYAEMIFSRIFPGPGCEPDPQGWLAARRRLEAVENTPDWLISALPDLAAVARDVVREECAAIARGSFDLAGFNTTFNLSPSLAMAERLKELGARPLIVLGGASCEAVMGETVLRMFPAVDFVCPGEGENALLSLVSHMEAGDHPTARIPGILTRACPNAARPASWQDLDDLPTPRYDDWLEQLSAAGIELPQRSKLIPIETSRGCWYGAVRHCTFCGLNGESLAYRSKSPHVVLRDIEAALDYGIANIHAVDNILDSRYFSTVLPALANVRHGARLFYEIKSKVTREQVKLMRDAGIRMVQPGIESLSTPVLRLMRKGVEAYHNIRLLRWCEELGIVPCWNMLYGFPRENGEDYIGMLPILPLLFHLRPPTMCRVRLDRFSPLDFDGPALGVARRWPAAPSRYIYGVSDEALEDLVYYFDFEADDGNDPEEYGAPLRALVADWHSSYPSAALVRADVPDGCWVFDTRPAAKTARARLTAAGLEVLRRADRGVRRSELEDQASTEETLSAIGWLISLGWLLPVDGRLLSLAVDYTSLVPSSLSEQLLEPFCLEMAASQHRGSPGREYAADTAREQALALGGGGVNRRRSRDRLGQRDRRQVDERCCRLTARDRR